MRLISCNGNTSYRPSAQIGAEVSRALEAKIAELMGGIELRLNPGSAATPEQQSRADAGGSQPSFDHRVDAAISNLEVPEFA